MATTAHVGPRGFVCDCAVLAGAVRPRGTATPYSASTLEEELKFIAFAPMNATDLCPGLNDFRALLRADGNEGLQSKRLIALTRVARAHYAADPSSCDAAASQQAVVVCVRKHAWRIVRASTLATDLAAISSCQSPGVRAAAALLRRCRSREQQQNSFSSSPRFAHFQLYHAGVTRGKSYSGAPYHALALDDPTLDECDLSLSGLAPSLKRYVSGVLGEAAGTIALGLAAECLDLPGGWLSIASWKQDHAGKAPLPCDALNSAPFAAADEAARRRQKAMKKAEQPGAFSSSSSSSSTPPPPLAFVYSHWNPNYPRQHILPSWNALFKEELHLHFSSSELGHVSRIGVSAEALGPNGERDAKFGGSKAFGGATHPCCSYFVARKSSFRSLGKLLALLVMRVYLQRPPPPALQGPGGGDGGGGGVGRQGGGGGFNTSSSSSVQEWWKGRAFAWARPDWAAIDTERGCWGFEGRAPNAAERRNHHVPRNEGALSYLGEAGTILYLYMTHQLVSLPPPTNRPPRGGNGTTVSASSTSSQTSGDVCVQRLEQSAVHRALFGRTSAAAMEAAYDRLASAYSLDVA